MDPTGKRNASEKKKKTSKNEYRLPWKLPVLVSFSRWIDATIHLCFHKHWPFSWSAMSYPIFFWDNQQKHEQLNNHQIATSRTHTHTHKTSQKPWKLKRFWDVLNKPPGFSSPKKVGSSVGDGLSTWGASFFKYLSDNRGRSGAQTGNFRWHFPPSPGDPGSPSEHATVNTRIMKHF